MMTCADFEVLLCDYLDGTLTAEQRQAIELHQEQCSVCAAFAADVTEAVNFIERAEEVQPPQELLTRIAFEIPRENSVQRRFKSIFGGRLPSILQPKFAMGMAMTILSFSLLGRFAGIEVRQLNAADLHPSKVWAAVDDRVHRTWARGVKYYENLRLVYEVQTRLQEWNEQDEAQRSTKTPAASGEGNKQK